MESLDEKWNDLLNRLQPNFEEELSLKSILFLIGVQELSQGIRSFDKEEKTYLFHIAVCKLLAPYGYYKFKLIDEDGWPHWDETKKLAIKEGKTPVVALCEKERPGFWVMVHSSDLEKLKKEK